MPEFRNKPIAVYGASGHTGRFVVAELRARGWPVIACGRDRAKLERGASGDAGVEFRVAALEDAGALSSAFRGACAVINCAGPFLDSAALVLNAALEVGAPYIDVTAEQGAALQLFDGWGERARSAGVPVIPAMGFYGGLGDLLATATLGDWPGADDITIAIALSYWRPTEGTRATGRRNTAPRLVLREGLLRELEQPAPTAQWTFERTFGEQHMIEVPFTEAVLIAQHIKTPALQCFLSANALADIRNPDTPPPNAADATGRSDQQFRMECRVTSGTQSRSAAVSGRDIYAVTAPLVAAAAERVVGERKGGVFAPGEFLDSTSLLASLSPHSLLFEPAA